MLIVCVALGWKVERARKQREAVTWIQKLGGSVAYDYQRDDNDQPIPNAEPPGPKWLMKQLGVDFFDDVVHVDLPEATQVSDVRPLSGLKSLRVLWLGHTQVSDVTALSGLTNLKWLNIDLTQVSDVTALSGLTSLEGLSLAHTQVSDLTPLAGLTSLKWLVLKRTQVSDITALAGLTSLERLYLGGTPVSVSEKAVDNLKMALPQCEIVSGRTNR